MERLIPLIIIRSILAVIVGMMGISLLTESIEFLSVAAVSGRFVTSETAYLAVRNQPLFLAAKLIYTGLSAFVGGYLTGWIAARARVWHGIVVAVLQAASLIWAAFFSPMASTGPLWMWLGLILLLPIMIVLGARQRARSLSPQTAALVAS
jgi:hypothetical protein